jgi:hypothetical protein
VWSATRKCTAIKKKRKEKTLKTVTSDLAIRISEILESSFEGVFGIFI